MSAVDGLLLASGIQNSYWQRRLHGFEGNNELRHSAKISLESKGNTMCVLRTNIFCIWRY